MPPVILSPVRINLEVDPVSTAYSLDFSFSQEAGRPLGVQASAYGSYIIENN